MTNASDYYGMGQAEPTAEDFFVSQITPPSFNEPVSGTTSAGLAASRPETNIGVAPYQPEQVQQQQYQSNLDNLAYLFQTFDTAAQEVQGANMYPMQDYQNYYNAYENQQIQQQANQEAMNAITATQPSGTPSLIDRGGGIGATRTPNFAPDRLEGLLGPSIAPLRTLQDYAGYIGGAIAPGIPGASAFDVLSQFLGTPTSPELGRFAGEAIVPTRPGEIALEFIPGIGTVPDIYRGARTLAREGAARTIGTPVFHAPDSLDAMRSIQRSGLNPGTAVTPDRSLAEAYAQRYSSMTGEQLPVMNFRARPGQLEDAGYYQRTTAQLGAPARAGAGEAGYIKIPGEPPAPPTGAVPETAEGFAGNIRLSKYPEDIRDTIKGWADANPDVVQSARRGVRSDEQVLEDARTLVNDVGGDFAKIQRRWKPGDAWNAEEVTAIRGSLNDATRRVLDAADASRAVDSTENHLKLAAAILEQQRIQQVVHGVTAEAGRALRSFRQLAAEGLVSGDVQQMNNLLARVMKDASPKDMQNLAEAIKTLDLSDPLKVNAFVRAVNKPEWTDYLYELWINSILSGPVTQLRNIFGNATATLYNPVERISAAGVEQIGARLTGRTPERFWQEAPAALVGAARGVPEGVRGALETLKYGFNPADVGKLEIRRQAFAGKPGRVIRFPTNMLEAADSFFHAINYRSALYGNAVRQARSEGLKGLAIENRVIELIQNPPSGLVKGATDEAERLLFRQDPGGVANWLMSGRSKVPGLKYVVPFVKTPANLLKYGVRHSPLGLADVPMWKRFMAGNPAASDEVARTLMGSAVGTGLGTLVATGVIDVTAGAPTDFLERDRFYREGKLPFAVKLPQVGWVQYNQIPVLDSTLTAVGSVIQGVRNGENVDDIAADALGTITQNLLDKSYLNGLTNLLDALDDPSRYLERFLTRQVSGFIPYSAALRQTAQTLDRTIRDPENPLENIMAGIPGLTGEVPPRLTAFGEESQRAFPSPIQVGIGEQSPIDAELERLGMDITFVSDQIGSRELTREQRDAYQRMAGQQVQQALSDLISLPAYQNFSDVAKEQAIARTIGSVRDEVRELLSKAWKLEGEPVGAAP